MKIKALSAIAALLVSAPAILSADETAELVINGSETMVIRTVAPDHLDGAVTEIISGCQ